jgi:hypothetical protein
MPKIKQERVERREHKRFQAPKGVFIGVGPHGIEVGRLRNISMDGLTFRYLGIEKQLSGSYVDIFMTNGDFYLGKLPIRIISDARVVSTTSSDSVTLRECWVKFKELTPQQRAKLKEFIESHTVGEA